MKKLNAKGFSVIEVLLVLVVVGAIAAVGWYVYDRQAKDESTVSNNSQPVPEATKLPSESIDYAKESVPSEWSVETMDYIDGGYSFISFTNKDNKCWVGANLVEMPKKQTLEEQRTEYYKANLSPLKEGQKLSELSKTSLEVKTKDGDSKKIEAQSIKGEAFGEVWYKKLAIVDVHSSDNVYSYARTIEVMCDTEEKLQSAKAAVKYILF